MKKITAAVLLGISLAGMADTSSNNTITRIIVSSDASSNSHLIQWAEPLNEKCTVSNGTHRTRISKLDKDLFSALLSVKLTNRTVSFIYDIEATSDAVPGHQSNDCQIRNIWFE